MRTLVHGMPIRNKGFTLIEILVVLLIIGITLSFTLVAFGDFGQKRRLVVFAEQFMTDIKLIQYEAVLENKPYGIEINRLGYRVVQFQPQHDWRVIASNPLCKNQPFPKDVTMRLRKTTQHPSIIINSSGDTTPFMLDVISLKQNLVETVVGEASGSLRLFHDKK